MEGSHLPRGSHERWSSTPVPPYQRGRTTRRNTRTRGLPRVGLRLRDRLAFVVVFVSPKGEGRRGEERRGEKAEGAREEREKRRREREKVGRVDDDVPSPRILSPSADSCFSLCRPVLCPPFRSCLPPFRPPLSTPRNAVFPVSLGKSKSPQTKGRAVPDSPGLDKRPIARL